jgi:hypothetical protein
VNGPTRRLKEWAGDSLGWVVCILVLTGALATLAVLVWLTHRAIEALH